MKILKKYKPEFITKRSDGTIDDTDYHLASSMLSYIVNECSFINGFNLVQESVDPKQYRKVMKVMKKIFEKLDQSQQYCMMTHEKDWVHIIGHHIWYLCYVKRCRK